MIPPHDPTFPAASAMPGGALVGPGSQPLDADGGALDYMVMPSGMMTFSAAHIPDSDEAPTHAAALVAAEAILARLEAARDGGEAGRIDLTDLSREDLRFIDQLLGEGEVSVILGARAQAQESVLAGVWRVRIHDDAGVRLADYAEVGAFPRDLLASAFDGAAPVTRIPDRISDNVFNAPHLLAEIDAAVAAEAPGPHSINLSLLPHTEEDLALLEEALGRGELVILSRGYGNCRIRSTATQRCWWVRYYNSQDTLILNSIEISPIPIVALAASEDIADSAERLAEILDIYR